MTTWGSEQRDLQSTSYDRGCAPPLLTFHELTNSLTHKISLLNPRTHSFSLQTATSVPIPQLSSGIRAVGSKVYKRPAWCKKNNTSLQWRERWKIKPMWGWLFPFDTWCRQWKWYFLVKTMNKIQWTSGEFHQLFHSYCSCCVMAPECTNDLVTPFLNIFYSARVHGSTNSINTL